MTDLERIGPKARDEKTIPNSQSGHPGPLLLRTAPTVPPSSPYRLRRRVRRRDARREAGGGREEAGAATGKRHLRQAPPGGHNERLLLPVRRHVEVAYARIYPDDVRRGERPRGAPARAARVFKVYFRRHSNLRRHENRFLSRLQP